MALSELYDRAISRACRSVRTVIPFQDADITDAQIWPQLEACLLGSVLKTDSMYTQMPVWWSFTFVSKEVKWHPQFFLNADRSVKDEAKDVMRFV